MSALLQQPTLPDRVDGVISLDPPMLQCRDCGEVWTDGGRWGGIGYAVIVSGLSGWGFIVGCPHERVRRCGDCKAAHLAECGADDE